MKHDHKSTYIFMPLKAIAHTGQSLQKSVLSDYLFYGEPPTKKEFQIALHKILNNISDLH